MDPLSICRQVRITAQLFVTTLTLLECQRPATRRYAPYASAPNDVWSLGVILVNLTCGRNPWKKASIEDSTFRAFLKDPNFLCSILPISVELNSILRRVFDSDPNQRISLPELRDLIVTCPRLTNSYYNQLPPWKASTKHSHHPHQHLLLQLTAPKPRSGPCLSLLLSEALLILLVLQIPVTNPMAVTTSHHLVRRKFSTSTAT